MKNVLITTLHRGVFFAQVDPEMDLTQKTLTGLKNCRFAIRWGVNNGVLELAHTGPTKTSRIGDPANVSALHDITAVFDVTDEAAEKWCNL